LHQAERELVGLDKPDYAARLRRAFRGAEAVLAVNPEIAALVEPYCRRVEVVPSGFDPTRFPAPEFNHSSSSNLTRFIFAGLVDEPMKGFSILFESCRQLWSQRQDFELTVTADRSPEWDAPFIRCIGWQTQTDLPSAIRAADVLVFPTIAQEALGRTAVEAMGCGKPVVASRLGGLSWVVEQDVTGLLVTPGDPGDLAMKMGQLMDDGPSASRMGRAGREKFERDFPWPVIVERHYRPLLQSLTR
jgi:glycosyltransferase involved in cell wall biosynthesis